MIYIHGRRHRNPLTKQEEYKSEEHYTNPQKKKLHKPTKEIQDTSEPKILQKASHDLNGFVVETSQKVNKKQNKRA